MNKPDSANQIKPSVSLDLKKFILDGKANLDPNLRLSPGTAICNRIERHISLARDHLMDISPNIKPDADSWVQTDSRGGFIDALSQNLSKFWTYSEIVDYFIPWIFLKLCN